MSDFDEYKRQGDPDKKELVSIWEAAIGLQQVDGLTPSQYLIDSARDNIEGKITLDEVRERIDSYYQQKTAPRGEDKEEADKVSANIAKILSEDAFVFSPAGYTAIHKRLFSGVYKFAGKVRDYNISKKEWVLNGDTVSYAPAAEIRAALDYDFAQEKSFDSKNLTARQEMEHIAQFISGLWQIHPFGEGNTRTTAVFTIKYLRTMGYKVSNDTFNESSWYFRNALVRANYSNRAEGVRATSEYLNRFFGNLLLGENNVLNNRDLKI